MNKRLRPIQAQDSEALFPLIYQQRSVTDWLLWDGPETKEEYLQGLAQRAEAAARGENHLHTIWVDDQPAGNIEIRPHNDFSADIGLWIGEPYHGQGVGSYVIQWMTAYGFFKLGLQKIEAEVFVGNHASRRIFEKCGYLLEGTIRLSCRKRGQLIDEWNLGITRQDYLSQPVDHLCREVDWQAAQKQGQYHAASLQTQGFIHLSRRDQIDGVAHAFYRDVTDLVLLTINPGRLSAELRYEPADDHAERGEYFPHLYGPLNLDAVQNVKPYRF